MRKILQSQSIGRRAGTWRGSAPWFLLLVVVSVSTWTLISSTVFGEPYDNLILSKLGVSEILKFLDATDHDKGLSEEMIAAKYILGDVPPDREPPARAVLHWKSLTPSERRQLKVVWFREHYMQLTAEEVNKHISLDYLRARAADEFRENPLAKTQKPEKEPARPDKKSKKGMKKGVTQWDGKVPNFKDTAVLKAKPQKKIKMVKKMDGDTPAAKPAAPAKAKEKSKAEKEADEVKSKQLPWFGLPNKMKNN